MPAGRPTEYDYLKLKPVIDQYIKECEDIDEDKTSFTKKKVKLPSIEGLCLKLKINKDTLYEWVKIHKEFSDDIDVIRNLQAERLLNKGLSGDYNPTIAKVLLTKHGYREGIENTGENGSAIQIDITKFLNKTYGESNEMPTNS